MNDLENIISSPTSANPDLERQVLGALLCNTDQIDAIGDSLSPEFFYNPYLRSHYGRLLAKLLDGEQVDAATMAHGLDGEALRTLQDAYACRTDGSLLPQHVAILRELWQRRKLLEIGQDISAMAASSCSTEEVISSAEARLFRLSVTDDSDEISYAKAFDDTWSDIQAAHQRAHQTIARIPVLPGLRTGFSKLDDMMGGLQNGHVILVGGRPSMGKTGLLVNIAENVAREGAGVAIVSYEMTSKSLMARSISSASRVPSKILSRGDISTDDLEEVYRSANELRSLPITLIDKQKDINSLMLSMRKLVRVNKVKLIIIDYVNLIPGGSGANATEKLGYISAQLKAAAKTLDIPLIIACQLNRQLESRDDQRPMLSDLKQSGNLEQDADVVFFVHRELYFVERRRPDPADRAAFAAWSEEVLRWRGLAELLLRKNRHGEIGEALVRFDAETTRFYDAA